MRMVITVLLAASIVGTAQGLAESPPVRSERKHGNMEREWICEKAMKLRTCSHLWLLFDSIPKEVLSELESELEKNLKSVYASCCAEA